MDPRLRGNDDGIFLSATSLKHLPVSKQQADELVATPERDPRILFDQMVSYFVRHGRPVPISSPEFQSGLVEPFVERDGMIFLPEQVAEYDKKRVTAKQLRQMTIFVDDEASAIEWLRQQLNHRPMTYQDIHPLFLNELSGWKKNEKPLELRAGFKKAWETKDYQQILDTAQKIPPAVLQEDEKLLMYYDNAQSMGGSDDFDW